jgi:hypothetical protein
MKKPIAPVLLAGFVLSLVAATGFAAPVVDPVVQQQPPPQPAAKVAIPKEVKDLLLAGLATRQAVKTDIPFTIPTHVFMPAQQNAYIYLYIKAKNGDLGFAVPPAPQIVDPSVAVPAAAKMQARFYVFIQFHNIENGTPTKLVKEIFVPARLEAEATGFDPNVEEYYSLGYPLAPGNYLASVALASLDLKKVGIQYHEFTLPDPKSFTKELDTTPILFLKNYEQVQAAETTTELHKDLFAWSIARITPNMDRVFKVGEPAEAFFFIYGAQPGGDQRYSIQVEFEVTQNDKPAIKFAAQTYASPLIDQPLPFKQTLEIKTGDVVKTQQQDLPAGEYVFLAKILDKISGLKTEKKINFTVK